MGNSNSSSSTPTASPRAWLDADAWKTRYAHALAAARYQLASPRTVTLYDTLASHLADATTGGVVFCTGVGVAQLLQRAMRVGAATPVVPHVVGWIAVGSSSVLALHFASLPREVYEEVKAAPVAGSTVVDTIAPKIATRVRDLQHAPFTVYMVMGMLSFRMLGGRANALAPSHFANLGAFHLKKASLPATSAYAETVERGVIQHFGRLYGCHTCGAKRAALYHADHMPPKLVAKKMNESLWRRITKREVAFRFYPQCSPCSNKQAHTVKMGRNDLKLHLSSLRLYHSTGFWLVLLCTGGLYFGGSSFSETADIRPPQPLPKNTSSTPQEPDEHDSINTSSADHALLVSLRQRERKLRRHRSSVRANAALVAAIDAELQSIKDCKTRLKETLRRQK